MAEKGRVFTGARARLLLQGEPFGYATGCDGGENITYERVKVLGNIRTQEHAPTDYDVEFSANFVRLVGETLKSKRFFPSVGNNSEEHLRNILTQGELTIVIEDVATNAIVMILEQAKAQNNRFSIAANGVVNGSVSFVGITMKDESEL